MSEVTIFQRQGSVSCDFEGIKNQLDIRLNQYRGIIFTEDTKTDAKKTVAEIRKDKADFSDRLKEAKKEYMKPWDEFNAQAQELVKMFDEPINFINKQVEDFENKRKEEKKERIEAIYAEIVPEGEIRTFLPLEEVYNEKWLNTTYTEKAIKDDIQASKIEVETGLNAIKGFNSGTTERALDIFKRTLNLSEAMAYISSYEEQKQQTVKDISVANLAIKTINESDVKSLNVKTIDTSDMDVIGDGFKGFKPKDEPTLPKEETFFNDNEVALTYTIFLKDTDRVKLDNFLKENNIEFFCHGGKR